MEFFKLAGLGAPLRSPIDSVLTWGMEQRGLCAGFAPAGSGFVVELVDCVVVCCLGARERGGYGLIYVVGFDPSFWWMKWLVVLVKK